METLLTDRDIMRIIGGNAKLMTYPDLNGVTSMDQLFGDYDKIILLYVNEVEGNDVTGHWCLLTRVKRGRKTLIEFNDPYDQLKHYTPKWKRESNQDTNMLTNLLYEFSQDPNHEVHYNEMKLQNDDESINTCGRWIALRGRFYKVPLETYQRMWRKIKSKGIDLDHAIVQLTNQLNGGAIGET
jgi:hypothetical protein